MYQIRLSPLAQTDYDTIFEYIADFDVTVAEDFMNSIMEKIETLEHSPLVGKVDVANNCRRLVKRPYLIYYRVLESSKTVEIIHIRHGARKTLRDNL